MIGIILSIFLVIVHNNIDKKKPKTKNALLIARVSTKEQENDGTSFIAQQQWVEDIAKKQSLHVVKRIFEVCSGKEFPKKHNKEILEIAKTEGIDFIVVPAIDRLARNLPYGAMLIEQLRCIRDVKIITTIGTFDTAKAHDRFVIGLLLTLAEQEQGHRLERMLLSMQNILGKGEYRLKGAPFGFEKNDTNRLTKKSWCDEIVNAIFSVFEQVKNISATARIINGKYKETFDQPITSSKVLTILQDPVYIGYLHWRGDLFGCDEKNNPWNELKVIEKEQFDRVQDLLKSIKKRYRRDNESPIGPMADEYGLDAVLIASKIPPPCQYCGNMKNHTHNGKGEKKEKKILQRKYICGECEKEFRFPKKALLKRIERLVSENCKKCGKTNHFSFIDSGSDTWELRCTCGDSRFFTEFCDRHIPNLPSEENKKQDHLQKNFAQTKLS